MAHLALGRINTLEPQHALDSQSNLAIGSRLEAVTGTAENNIGYGRGALAALTEGRSNIGIGTIALTALTTGSRNVAIGTKALTTLTTGTENIAIGQEALSLNNSLRNIAIGPFAAAVATGEKNVGLGFNSLKNTTTGASNTALGVETMAVNKLGKQNVAIGASALVENIEGNFNTVVGCLAVGQNSTGKAGEEEGKSERNTAIGYKAGAKNSAAGNVFLGFEAGAAETESNRLYIANTNTTEPLIWGNFGVKELKIYGKLEVTDKVTLGEEQLSGKSLVKETVVENRLAKTVQEKLLSLVAPTALTARAEKTAFEPSPGKATIVTGLFEGATLTRTKIRLLVGATVVTEAVISAANTGVTAMPFSFPVAAGAKWEWEKVEGTVESLKTSYTVL